MSSNVRCIHLRARQNRADDPLALVVIAAAAATAAVAAVAADTGHEACQSVGRGGLTTKEFPLRPRRRLAMYYRRQCTLEMSHSSTCCVQGV